MVRGMTTTTVAFVAAGCELCRRRRCGDRLPCRHDRRDRRDRRVDDLLRGIPEERNIAADVCSENLDSAFCPPLL